MLTCNNTDSTIIFKRPKLHSKSKPTNIMTQKSRKNQLKTTATSFQQARPVGIQVRLNANYLGFRFPANWALLNIKLASHESSECEVNEIMLAARLISSTANALARKLVLQLFAASQPKPTTRVEPLVFWISPAGPMPPAGCPHATLPWSVFKQPWLRAQMMPEPLVVPWV